MANSEFWFALLSFAVLMYVILDGFDLGLGILYPWFEEKSERAMMMGSIAHVWDGNETWLVFGGVILFAAFPAVYSALLSSAYLPIIVMLLALVLRGAAFEYRFKATTSTGWWDRAFSHGSSVAAFCQGFILGCVVTGHFGLSLFSVITGFAVMSGYALLGCCWMIIKKSGTMQARAARLAQHLTLLVMFFFVVVCLYSLSLKPTLWQRWFGWPDVLFLSPLPPLAIALAVWIHQHCRFLIVAIKLGEEKLPLKLPFILTVLLFAVGFIGLWVGMHPYLLPGQYTLYSALAPESSLRFVGPGVVILLPIILGYTLFGYRVFKGKVATTG